jgi:hypothetical protein
MRFKTGEPEIDSLEKRLSRNEREMKRTAAWILPPRMHCIRR